MKTNKEKYKSTFSSLSCIAPISVEEKPMKKQHQYSLAFACALVLVLGTGTICYASDVGGIRTLVTGWIRGEQKQVEAVDNGGPGYEFYKDGEDVPFMGGGGVAIDDDGSETKLPAQDVMEVNSQYIEKKEDGSVWIFDHEFSRDITDLLENGKAKIIVNRQGADTYWDIEVEEYSITYQISPYAPEDEKEYVRIS